MDNWFSGNEAASLRWVAFLFCTALAIGTGALMTAVFMSTAVALDSTVVFDVFYVFFAIRFINYTHRFHIIEEAMDTDVSEDTEQQKVLLSAVVRNISGNGKKSNEQERYNHIR
jgi:hypothetical protein